MRVVLGTVAAAALAAGLFLVGNGGTHPAGASGQEKGSLKYNLAVEPESVKTKAGEKGAVKIVLKPQGNAHVDPRAPLSLEAKSSGAVAVDKASFGHADGKEAADKSSVEFAVPYTAKAAGADKILVHADFFLCTPKICERQVTDITVPVTVE